MNEKEYTWDDVYVSLTDNYQETIPFNPEEMMKQSVISSSGFQTRAKLPFDMHNHNKHKKVSFIN